MTVEISNMIAFVDSALQTDGVDHVIIDGIVQEGPLELLVVGIDGSTTEFYADPYKSREPIDYFYANKQLLEETYDVEIETIPEDDLEVRIVFRKRRVISPEALYRNGSITRSAFAYVQSRYTEGANIAVTGSDLDGIKVFINYLLESVSHSKKTVVVDPNLDLAFGGTNDVLTVVSGLDSEIFSMSCQMNPNRIVSIGTLSEEDAVSLHAAIEKGVKFVCAMPDEGNGYVTKGEVSNFDLEIELELNDEDIILVRAIRENADKGKKKSKPEIISQYFNGQHVVTI